VALFSYVTVDASEGFAQGTIEMVFYAVVGSNLHRFRTFPEVARRSWPTYSRMRCAARITFSPHAPTMSHS
jgi:hypothetical protein